MTSRKSEPINFLENPDNVAIGDWVKDIHDGRIGQISERVSTGPNMLEFWIKFADTTLGTALAMDLRKAEPPTTICKTVNLNCIKIDSNLQQRVKLDKSVIEEYAEAFINGATFPPITIWSCTDKNKTYLVDGFHRVEAANIAGIAELPYTEKSGTYREAKFFTLGVNATHGLPRSNADKRKVVTTLLQDPEWSQLSNNAIASQCGVSHQFVNNLRKSILQRLQDTKLNNPDGSTDTNLNNKRKVTRGGKTYIQDTTNIGKGKIKETENDNPPKKSRRLRAQRGRKYIKNGVEVEMEVSKAILDPDIFPELPGQPLFDSENNSDSKLPQEKQSLTKSGNNQTDNNDSTVIPNPDPEFDDSELKDSGFFPSDNYPEDNRPDPEDVIKDLWDDDNEEDSVSEDSVNEDSVSNNENNEDKPKNPNPTSPYSSKHNKPNNIKRPQKKEIILREGLNYFIRESEDKCRWYVELDKEIYQGLKIYQDRVQAMSVNAGIIRFLENEGILLRPFPENKIIDEKLSAITSLTNDTRSKLEDYITKHGEYGIRKLLELESS